MSETIPANDDQQGTRDRVSALVLQPDVIDHAGAHWLHKDYVLVTKPWEYEGHIPPVKEDISFGDVESFVEYVKFFGDNGGDEHRSRPLVTWTPVGLHAVMDYHEAVEGDEVRANRTQWHVRMPFKLSDQWLSWRLFASGSPVGQRQAIEFLEDHAEEIVLPDAGDVLSMLRDLRANVSAKAETKLEADGSIKVSFDRENRVSGASQVSLPAEIEIAVPVLKGHTEEVPWPEPDSETLRAVPVKYRVKVRVRPTAEDDASLSLRFSIPLAERTLEDAYAERIEAAKSLLGSSFVVLRGAS